ncbi:dynein regulatory complex subunit 6-like [Anopheles aquasalis]|uniref:dynein regulatory complex subunit 6-like n=1 Tax=Anopheles aquasalis TaxID=42839 RepID=UPI00215AFD91|nr:dynein regulatory complex subunit 6-like [Anopheles aquasalis]
MANSQSVVGRAKSGSAIREYYRELSGYDEFGPQYADLPMEILVKIFTYLNASDRCVAGQTCQRWLEATQHNHFRERLWLALHRTTFDTNVAPMADLLASSRTFPNLSFSEVDFERVGNFFERFGGTIRRIEFRACEIQERTLYNILRHLSGLRSLTIHSCRDLFMCIRLFEDPTERAELMRTLANVRELRLTNNQYLSDATLHRFCEVMPSLAVLDLSGCHISFHKGLYRKFYPASNGQQPSESVLTFHYISRLIEERKQKLLVLNFSETLIDDSALELLTGLQPDLRLERLELNQCEQLSPRGLEALLHTQTNTLTQLHLTRAYRLTDTCLQQICHELPALRVLRMRECRALSDQGVRELAHLRALEVLDVSYCRDITGEGLLAGLVAQSQRPNCSLRELHIRALNHLSVHAIVELTKWLPELRLFDLGFHHQSMFEIAMQHIFRNLVRLTHLDLEHCDYVSDNGMTGIGMGPLVADGDGRSEAYVPRVDAEVRQAETPNTPNVPVADPIQPPPMRISIRSRAEQQIVEEAERKQRLMAFINTRQPTTAAASKTSAKTDDQTTNGYSISRLRQLRILNLTRCNQLTDVSLLCDFRLPELQQLSLAQCSQISVDGIRALVRSCPSIEQLDLSECHSLNDRAVELITEHLPRLRTLSLRRCHQLTDFSLDYIACHARQLRMLDVRGCKHMCEDPAMRLVSLPLLTTILPGLHDESNGISSTGFGITLMASSLSSTAAPRRPIPRPPAMPLLI